MTIRQVMEDHSPNDARGDASALGQEDEGRTSRDKGGGGAGDKDSSSPADDDGAAPGRPPVARWMRGDT